MNGNAGEAENYFNGSKDRASFPPVQLRPIATELHRNPEIYTFISISASSFSTEYTQNISAASKFLLVAH